MRLFNRKTKLREDMVLYCITDDELLPLKVRTLKKQQVQDILSEYGLLQAPTFDTASNSRQDAVETDEVKATVAPSSGRCRTDTNASEAVHCTNHIVICGVSESLGLIVRALQELPVQPSLFTPSQCSHTLIPTCGKWEIVVLAPKSQWPSLESLNNVYRNSGRVVDRIFVCLHSPAFTDQ